MLYIEYIGFFGLYAAGVWIIFLKDGMITHSIKRYQKKKMKKYAGWLRGSFTLNIPHKKQIWKQENQIYKAVSLLQNFSSLKIGEAKGGIFMIEQLRSYVPELGYAFDHLIYYLRINKPQEALVAFQEKIDSPSAVDFGKILINLDQMEPAYLKESILSLRENIRERGITEEKRRNEVISDMVYIPVMGNVMLIFINFIYIAYFAQQQELFQQLL